MRKKTLSIALLTSIGLGGCATVGKTSLPVPKPVQVVTSEERLMCVSKQLDDSERAIDFTVLEFPDKTGKINTTGGPDATGAFNTQAADSMLFTALGRTGLDVVHTSASYRQLWEWQKQYAKDSNAAFASLAISGAISSTDFVGGKGFGGEIAGVGGEVYTNTILQSIDLYVLTLPSGPKGPQSGRQVAEVTVTTEIKQKGLEIGISAFDPIGKITKKYVAMHAGYNLRAPHQYSTRAMVEFGLAAVLSELFNIEGCLPEEEGTTPTVIAAAK